MINFSKVVKELRLSKHMTQSDLARELGVSKSMISSYETAMRSPSYEVLIKIVRFFNVSMDYVFGFNDNHFINVKGLDDKEKKIVNDLIQVFKENKEKQK